MLLADIYPLTINQLMTEVYMIRSYALILLLLTACGGGNPVEKTGDVAPTTDAVVTVTETRKSTAPLTSTPTVTEFSNTNPSWYELKQWYNGIPKYSGILGTYTAKHLPAAVSCSLGKWATYSENHTGSLEIFALNLNTGDKHLVHTVSGFTNPHQNGSIQCGGGKLYLAVAAFSYKHNGYLYSSTDGVNWSLEQENMRAYPQMHWVNGSLLTLYTQSEKRTDIIGGLRRVIYSSCNNEPIIDDDIQHYMMSYYDGIKVKVIFNDLINGPDYRTNLNYTESVDGGCTWSTPVRWYNGGFVYLKDFTEINGVPTALITLSDSANPREGDRFVFKVTANSINFVLITNHNYTTGALKKDGGVVFPAGINYYAGGTLLDKPHCNYVRRVWGSNDEFIASCAESGDFGSVGNVVHIK